MEKKIKSIFRFYTFPLEVKWRLTELCNYSCSYCIRKGFTEKSLPELIEQQNLKIFKAVPDVISIINKRAVKTKINLTGGEITLLDLPNILKLMFELENGPYISRISIVTNLSKPASYYKNLIEICKQNNCEFTISCSWHSEFASLDSFISKAVELKNDSSIRLCAETVSSEHNQDKIQDFIDMCEKNDIIYKVDANFFSEDKSNLGMRTSSLIKGGFRVIFEDGTEDHIKSLRLLLLKYGDKTGKLIDTKGFYCSIDYNFIRLQEDMYLSSDGDNCKLRKWINECAFREEPKICNHNCSLCGSMSVSRSKEDLLEFLQNNTE